MEFDRFLLESGESGESGRRGLLPPVDLCFLTNWRRANSQVPPLDADLQTEAAGTLSEPLDSGWLQVTRRRRHQGSSRLCLFFFLMALAKKRRVLGEGLIGRRGCLWMTSWRLRGEPPHFRRRENFSQKYINGQSLECVSSSSSFFQPG